jgi:multimeric flavodoxin WrbA
VRYIEKRFPQHELDVIQIAQRAPKLERDPEAFQDVIERVRASDGVLWAFPLYVFLVHANYKRFIELVWERGVEDAFAGKHAATLSTSIHFYDHTAHNYMLGICDDLDMPAVGFFSAAMQDLLQEEGREALTNFAEDVFDAIASQRPTPRRFAPLVRQDVAYAPTAPAETVDAQGKRVVVLTDATPEQATLHRMIERFAAAFGEGDSAGVTVVNMHDLDIKGGCMGCLRCGKAYECAYMGKDGYIDFYNNTLRTADILIFAGALRDRYLSATWKQFFDRSFFNTHTPSLMGKQFGFIISGPLSQVPNLRQILQAYVEWQGSNLVGFVTDESGDGAQIDGLLQDLAGRLIRFAVSRTTRPITFLGMAGMKVFRDDVWGNLRLVFRADHRAYRRMGVYDFPQRDLRTRLLNAVLTPVLAIPPVRKMFESRIKEGMIAPYQRVLERM